MRNVVPKERTEQLAAVLYNTYSVKDKVLVFLGCKMSLFQGKCVKCHYYLIILGFKK